MPDSERLCIWNNRGLFMGYLPEFGMRRQGAAAVCVGLDKEIEISTDEREWIRCRTALTQPLTDHAIRFDGGYCALLFIDPHNPDFSQLVKSNAEGQRHGMFIALREESWLIDVLLQIRQTPSNGDISRYLSKLRFCESEDSRPTFDDRLTPVMRHMLANLAENTTVEELAQIAQMSPSSLEHLFKQHVGIPMRMFRNWFRMKAAVLAASKGKSLTEAALTAGFFDSAHFSRAFKETFGLPPSEIFSPRRKLEWFIEDTAAF